MRSFQDRPTSGRPLEHVGPQFGASRAIRFTAAVVLALCLGGCGEAAGSAIGYAASAWPLVCGDPTCGHTIQSPPATRPSCPGGFVRVTETPTTGGGSITRSTWVCTGLGGEIGADLQDPIRGDVA